MTKTLTNCCITAGEGDEPPYNDRSHVTELLANRPDLVNAYDSAEVYQTALQTAAAAGHADMVKTILEQGFSPNDTADGTDDTPLHIAAQNGYTTIVKLLLQAGADIDPENENELTPLWLAAANNQAKVVCELIKAGANANYSCTYYNHTPLMIALP